MSFNTFERRAVLSLAAIFSFRMLGLFMILPVFTLYANQLHGATPWLIGITLGVYGLTQALLQIPFGMCSDRFGRKPIITLGLVLFGIGSVVAAMSHSIAGVMIGRALQGGGAIGSTLIAMIADVTREDKRTQAMATIGITIGVSFSIAMVLGPVLNQWIHVNGIFALTALLAVGGLLILHTVVPTPQKLLRHTDSQPVPELFKEVLTNSQLLRLDIGIFIQHAILTATFIVIPVALFQGGHIPEARQWMVYLPVLLISFCIMVPMIIIAEKKRRMKPIFLISIALLMLAQALLALLHHSAWLMGLSLLIFFTGFNVLEASLPSLISKIAPAGSKGTAMGVYSSSQFLGIFFGGMIGGWLYGQHHFSAVFWGCAALALVWLVIAATMQKPRHVSTHIVNVDNISAQQAQSLLTQWRQVAGVIDVAISTAEGVAYLKVDKTVFDDSQLTTTPA